MYLPSVQSSPIHHAIPLASRSNKVRPFPPSSLPSPLLPRFCHAPTDLNRPALIVVSQAPVEKKKTVIKGSSYLRILSEKEKEELATKEMFDKAKRLDFDDEDIEGIPKRGNTDAGFDDDDWE
jgi:hypothetical protein